MLNRIKEILSNPEVFKERIFIKAVPAGYRSLEYCVHKQVGDLCLALYIELSSEQEPDADVTAGLPQKVLDELIQRGTTEDDVWELAKKNTVRIYRPSLCGMADMMMGFLGSGALPLPDLFGVTSIWDDDILVLSARRQFGPEGCASTVFLPEVQKKLTDLFSGDFYAVFLTSKEVILHPGSLAAPEALKAALADTCEAAVSDGKRLSAHVWRYFSSSGELTPVA